MARRTHCPQGRQLYRVDEIPTDLATVSMLRLQRRRLGEGQQPVASLLYRGNEYTGLYEIAASVELKPLSPGKQAAYDAARRCARCGQQRGTPWPKDVLTARRVCEPCGEAEAESSWRSERIAVRAAAAAWAAEVLADPAAVLIHCKGVGLLLGGAYAVELRSGTVLLDAPRFRHNERDFGRHGRPDNWDDTTVSVADIADQVRALAGRRLIAWSAHYYGPHGLVWNMRTLLGEDLERNLTVAKRRPRPPRPAPGILCGDELGHWYSDWIGERVRAGGSWRYDRWIRHLELPGPAANPDVAGQARHMQVLLARMAIDDHPAGPPTCPALNPGSRELCGATGDLIEGLCRAHLVARIQEGADRG